MCKTVVEGNYQSTSITKMSLVMANRKKGQRTIQRHLPAELLVSEAYVCVCMYRFNSGNLTQLKKKKKKHRRQMERQTKANYIYKLQANQKTHKNL